MPKRQLHDTWHSEEPILLYVEFYDVILSAVVVMIQSNRTCTSHLQLQGVAFGAGIRLKGIRAFRHITFSLEETEKQGFTNHQFMFLTR